VGSVAPAGGIRTVCASAFLVLKGKCMSIWIVSILLILTLILLITEKIPIDLTAMGIMVALMVTGILTPLEAVAGLANPAVVTVGAMFLISRGMIRTGLLVFRPGNYRYTEYFRLGIPLNMLVLVMGSVFIPLIWPF
jgi:di/tricarboxylate transporter